MGDQPAYVVQSLVLEEVRRIVADAVGDGMCLSAHASAAGIMWTYPNSGMGEEEIVDEIVSAASAAGVAVADEPASESLNRDGEGTHFGVLFVQSQELYEALDEMVLCAEGPIDPAEITGRLIEKNPSLEFTEEQLQTAVRRVTDVAGKPVRRSENAERI